MTINFKMTFFVTFLTINLKNDYIVKKVTI